jgi:hypothetical protein
MSGKKDTEKDAYDADFLARRIERRRQKNSNEVVRAGIFFFWMAVFFLFLWLLDFLVKKILG